MSSFGQEFPVHEEGYRENIILDAAITPPLELKERLALVNSLTVYTNCLTITVNWSETERLRQENARSKLRGLVYVMNGKSHCIEVKGVRTEESETQNIERRKHVSYSFRNQIRAEASQGKTLKDQRKGNFHK